MPLAHGRQDVEVRILGADGRLHAHLVVALAGGTVRDRSAALVMRQPNQFLGDNITGQGRAKKATALVNGAGLQDGHSEIAEKDFAPVDHLRRGRAEL